MKVQPIIAFFVLIMLIGLFGIVYSQMPSRYEAIDQDDAAALSVASTKSVHASQEEKMKLEAEKHENYRRLRNWAEYFIDENIYGGSYIDENGNFVFLLTEPLTLAQEEIMRNMASYPLEIKLVDFSLKQLEETEKVLHEMMNELSLEWVMLNVKRNRVEVLIQEDHYEDSKAEIYKRVDADQVDVKIGKMIVEHPRPVLLNLNALND